MGEAKRRKNPDGSYRYIKGDKFRGNQESLGRQLMVAAKRGLFKTNAFQRVLAKRMGAAR
jgi:hypothetical protein